jgi:DNA-directed RNA polymerase subunit omega
LSGHAPGVLGKGIPRRKWIYHFYVAFGLPPATLRRSISEYPWNTLNAELTKKALEKVGNPNVLINLISRRVRQLNAGAGALSRPLIADVGNMGAADIALLEIVEGKMGFDLPEPVELTRPTAKKRSKKH